MNYWIGNACKTARESAGLSREVVATILETDRTKLWRFEKGETWPNDLDRVVSTYASLTGRSHPATLWAEAAKMWEREPASSVDPQAAIERFAQQLSEAARRGARARRKPAK